MSKLPLPKLEKLLISLPSQNLKEIKKITVEYQKNLKAIAREECSPKLKKAIQKEVLRLSATLKVIKYEIERRKNATTK